MFGIIGGVYLYQCYSEGRFNGAVSKAENGFDATVHKLKNVFFSLGGTTFEFKPEAVLDKKIRETGKITYKSGKIQIFENNYTAHEKRSFSNNILLLRGKREGDFDPVLKPLMENGYLKTIRMTAPYCPANFIVSVYPSELRAYIYLMPQTPLFDGKTWEVNSCGGKFLCSYSASMKESENKIDLGCSGSIGKTQTTISGTITINEKFDGFSGVEMEIMSENGDLTSIWNFYEEISERSIITDFLNNIN